jgi:hypothetical protein
MQEEYMSKNFDHLGIVSIICDEIGDPREGRQSHSTQSTSQTDSWRMH